MNGQIVCIVVTFYQHYHLPHDNILIITID